MHFPPEKPQTLDRTAWVFIESMTLLKVWLEPQSRSLPVLRHFALAKVKEIQIPSQPLKACRLNALEALTEIALLPIARRAGRVCVRLKCCRQYSS